MASSYDNDLRLNEMATGDQSGAWGTVTNLNLEMISEAFSYGTRAIANATSDEITLTDGALDADRSMYLRLSGGGQACTVTFLPATISKVWLIENATSATLTMKQGSSPAGIAIPAGQVKMIATDGGGSTNGVVYDLLTDVNLAGTTVMSGATIDDVAIDGKVITMTGSAGDTATLTVAADGALAIATTDAAAAAANISITADGTFTATGTTVTLTSSGALSAAGTTITLDSAGDIILDAAGDEVIFKDGSVNIGHVSMDSDNLTIKSLVSDKDIILQGNDGGSGITALTLDMSAAGAATFNSTVTRALTRGSIDVGNSSGVSAPLAKGSAGTFLTSDGTDLSFAEISSGSSSVVWPSDFASPTNTYTSSGTWSKGSLADDDYVWIYLVGGGGGGGRGNPSGYQRGGTGGSALLLYGQAQWFNGGAYVIGAGTQSSTTSTSGPTPSTFTLTSANNSTVFTTGTSNGTDEGQTGANIFKIIEDKTSPITIGGQVISARLSATSAFILPATVPTIPNEGSGTKAYNGGIGGYSSAPGNSVFGGGGGEGAYANNGSTRGGSLYAGRGAGYTSGIAGPVPGGGGFGGNTSNGAGGAGNLRVYHV